MKKVFRFFFRIMFGDSGNVFYDSQERRGDSSGYTTRAEAEDAAKKKAARYKYEIDKKTGTDTNISYEVFRRKVLPIILLLGMILYWLYFR